MIPTGTGPVEILEHRSHFCVIPKRLVLWSDWSKLGRNGWRAVKRLSTPRLRGFPAPHGAEDDRRIIFNYPNAMSLATVEFVFAARASLRGGNGNQKLATQSAIKAFDSLNDRY